MSAKKENPLVRINVLLTEEERDAFDRWCRYGPKPRTSMTWRIRELIAMDAAGKLAVPRGKPPRRGGVPYSKTPPAPPAKTRKKHSPAVRGR